MRRGTVPPVAVAGGFLGSHEGCELHKVIWKNAAGMWVRPGFPGTIEAAEVVAYLDPSMRTNGPATPDIEGPNGVVFGGVLYVRHQDERFHLHSHGYSDEPFRSHNYRPDGFPCQMCGVIHAA